MRHLLCVVLLAGCSGQIGDRTDADADPGDTPAGGDSTGGDPNPGDSANPGDAYAGDPHAGDAYVAGDPQAGDPDASQVVSNATELTAALAGAGAGTTILLASGTYTGEFHLAASGSEGAEIVVRGPADRSAVLDGGGVVSSWQGVLTIESEHHIVVENLEIRNTGAQRYGVLIGATDTGTDGCHDIVLRNLHVHDVGEEIIKIQGKNTHDILVEDCIVHSNQDWSGIDVQGHWGGTPAYTDKPRRVVIRRNLIYDIAGFAGIGNEFADNVHAYDNVVLGSAIGLDIGCGNYNIVHNNLVASYTVFNALLDDSSYQAIDLSAYTAFTAGEISSFTRARCVDGIALSGNYMSLVFDNEITDCTGDLYLAYDHWIDNERHNSVYGHQNNLIFRNRLHDNDAYRTIREYNKQDPGRTVDQMYFGNLFANNNSSTDILFEHSEGLLFFGNTLVNGDDVSLLEASTDAVIKNNIFFASGCTVSGDSTGADVSDNYDAADAGIFVAADDYRLDTSGGNVCVDTGVDLSSTLTPRFQAFRDLYATEYAFYSDFDIPFDFETDLDGDTQTNGWDLGAYWGH